MDFTMTYFKTSEEIIRQLQNLWDRLEKDDLYGKAVINDAIMVIGSIGDDIKNYPNMA
jgi:hypothetical protein